MRMKVKKNVPSVWRCFEEYMHRKPNLIKCNRTGFLLKSLGLFRKEYMFFLNSVNTFIIKLLEDTGGKAIPKL